VTAEVSALEGSAVVDLDPRAGLMTIALLASDQPIRNRKVILEKLDNALRIAGCDRHTKFVYRDRTATEVRNSSAETAKGLDSSRTRQSERGGNLARL
jgi:hypothetical protein